MLYLVHLTRFWRNGKNVLQNHFYKYRHRNQPQTHLYRKSLECSSKSLLSVLQIVWLWKNINSLILARGIQQSFSLFNSPVVNVLLVGSTIEVTGSSIIVHHTEIFQFGTTLCYRINKYTCKRRRCKLEKIYAHPPNVNITWNKYNLLT